jgi:hypothetical protein
MPLISSANTRIDKRIAALEPFRVSKRIYQATHRIIDSCEETGEGSSVFSDSGACHQLVSALGTGGEGTAYLTDRGFVCKVYKRDKLTGQLLSKLRLMVTRPLAHPAICWPISLAKNSSGQFIGYLMPMARGQELKRTVFIKPLLQSRFPHWFFLGISMLAISWSKTKTPYPLSIVTVTSSRVTHAPSACRRSSLLS